MIKTPIIRYTLSLVLTEEAGGLTRLNALFTRRGFPLESIVVGRAEKPGLLRMTLVVPTDAHGITQVVKQLYKLVCVLLVEDVTFVPSIERELLLIKLRATDETRQEILDIASIFRAKVVDITPNSLTLEITGDPGKVKAMENMVKKFGLLEVARTGKISLKHESHFNSESLRSNKVPGFVSFI